MCGSRARRERAARPAGRRAGSSKGEGEVSRLRVEVQISLREGGIWWVDGHVRGWRWRCGGVDVR